MDLTTRVIKKLEYSLAVTTFSSKECRLTLRHVLDAGLLATGICHFLYRAIMHGLLKYQGLGIPSLCTTQGITHVEALLDAIPMEGITGKLLVYLEEDFENRNRITRNGPTAWLSLALVCSDPELAN